MADTDTPTLEVGFAIDFFDSFGQLKSLDDLIGAASANAVREFQKVEAAAKGAVNLNGATSQITSFGAAATRELAAVARETNRAEKAGEAMVRQIERQIEVYGKSASEIRNMRAEQRALNAEQQGLTELAERIRNLNGAMVRLESGTGKVTSGAMANRMAMQGASYQVQDFITQVSMGANPVNAFAVQGAQLAGQFSNIEGKAGAAARFFMGPWGLAITAGLMVLGPLVSKILDGNNALEDAVDKLRKDAKEREIARQAQERFKNSAEGVTAAIRDSIAASKDWIAALDTTAEAANKAAEANLNKMITVRQDTIAEIARAKVLAENAKGSWIGANGPNGAQSVVANQYAAEVERLEALLQVQEGLLRDAKAEVNRTRIDLAAEAASRVVDPIKRINAAYDDQVEALKRAAAARAKAGQTIGSELTREFATIERNRQTALNAEEDRQAALKQTQVQIGRTINLTEAREIAEKAGGRVTSGLRSHEKQQELYDKYVAYKNGTGPWAALAAKPGSSNHERGLALDVAKTDGMTLKKLVAAYRAAGVKLTEALDEGSHFHIAWSAGKAVTAAAKEADKIIEWLEEQRAQANGNVWKLTQEISSRQQSMKDETDELVRKNGPILGSYDKQVMNDADALTDAGFDNARDALDAFMRDLDKVSERVDLVANSMREAFGSLGGAIGDVIVTLDEYGKRQAAIDAERSLGVADQKRLGELRAQEVSNQLSGMVALTGAAKGLFSEHSKGYKAMAAAEKALTLIQLARTAVDVAGGAARMFASLGPFAFPAVAAMLGVMASLGFGGGGSSGSMPKTNTGTGTVLGDSSSKSESIKRAIDSLKEVDTLMLGYSRQMAASLNSIESQIGNFASLLVRQGDISASGGIAEGFKTNAIGSVLSKIPLIGGILGGLFGTKTTIKQTGLYGGAQSIGDILNGGFDASYYSVINRRKKAFGVTYSNKTQTKYADADPMLEDQFTLILRQFNDAIAAAAGPLGQSTAEIQNKLNGFVLNIGKIDLKGLTGAEIEEKLNAVFGAAADNMANAAFPGMQRFQQVGEGLFETLVRVASTVEAVSSSFDLLGFATAGLNIDMKMAIADQFESIADMSSAVQGYFETFYTKQEQAAAKTAQFAKVFDSLGLTMPSTLAGFRALVEAQDLTTAAGQATYATLLQLAPAFADLQASMNGAKSAADILSERQDLERKLLEMKGDTAALRDLDLAQLDASNRALQEQIWAVQDAKEAAQAADQLRQAWTSVGDSIMDEVRRIRGLTDGTGAGGFAALQGQFNAATAAARGGDLDAAGRLVSLSQAMLNAAALSATSKQDLDRVKAQTAASLEQTNAIIRAVGGVAAVASSGGNSPASTLAAAATAQAATPTASNDNMAAELRALRQEVAQMRAENKAGLAATAGNTGRIARKLDDVTAASGGEAISVAVAA